MKRLGAKAFTFVAVMGAMLLLGRGAGGVARADDQKEPSKEGIEFFEKNIRPVLADSCYKCHSQKAKENKKLKAKLISVTAFITATMIRGAIAPWTQAALNGLVIWLVVSGIAVATGLSMRRWVEAVYSCILPITGRQLVFLLYLAMILPGVLACVALSTAHHFSPNWGLGIPAYMLVVFLPAPLTLFRWERPTGSRPHYLPLLGGSAIQQAVWPAWAGVFCSMLGLPFMPTWFFVYLAALAALFSIAAYRALRAGIHSPTTLESHDGATLKSV